MLDLGNRGSCTIKIGAGDSDSGGGAGLSRWRDSLLCIWGTFVRVKRKDLILLRGRKGL